MDQLKKYIELCGIFNELVKLGLVVPLVSILVSLNNLIIITAIAIASVATVLCIWKKDTYQ